MQSLAVKYRPTDWDDVVSQESIVKILTRQLVLNEIKNAYLFCGASGCGKTTAARIFANKINNNIGTPIEIDGASNNGVDSVRAIIKSAQERAVDGKYKIYIIDECQAISTAGWQAFLKGIEEPAMYTIYIFCTTDPQKIPATILNRVQRFNFSRISSDKINERLRYICEQERFTNYVESVDYISKIANGGMRDAISMLDKCSSYSTDLNINNVVECLGNYSYATFFSIINNLIDDNEKQLLTTLNTFYDSGHDLKLFIDQFLSFCLDVSKYLLFQSCTIIKVPSSMEADLKQVTNFDNAASYYSYVIDKLLLIKNMLKQDTDLRTTIEVMLLQIARCK